MTTTTTVQLPDGFDWQRLLPWGGHVTEVDADNYYAETGRLPKFVPPEVLGWPLTEAEATVTLERSMWMHETGVPIVDRHEPSSRRIAEGDRVTFTRTCENLSCDSRPTSTIRCDRCTDGRVPVCTVTITKALPIVGYARRIIEQRCIERVSPSYLREWYQDEDGDWMHRQVTDVPDEAVVWVGWDPDSVETT